MKLIIDVSEELYKDIQSRDWKNGELVFSDEWKAIHNDTPLDDLRDEIEKAIWEDVVISLDGTDETRIPSLSPDDVFEIIDKYKYK